MLSGKMVEYVSVIPYGLNPLWVPMRFLSSTKKTKKQRNMAIFYFHKLINSINLVHIQLKLHRYQYVEFHLIKSWHWFHHDTPTYPFDPYGRQAEYLKEKCFLVYICNMCYHFLRENHFCHHPKKHTSTNRLLHSQNEPNLFHIHGVIVVESH